jgi:hypothetical protein
MSVNHEIRKASNLKKGDTVKEGEVITYHGDFFQYDPITKDISWCHGIPATVAIMAKDVTLEDSNMITAEFAEKLRFDSIYPRAIRLTTDMTINSHVSVGDKVAFNDILINLSYEETSTLIKSDIDELFSDLKQVEYRSKHEGVISEIKIFYVAEELNLSLSKFISKITYNDRRKANATKGTRKESKYTTVNRVAPDTRISGIVLGESDILVIFYIKSNVGCSVGDKIIFDSSLKTVVGRVEANEIVTESGKKIDAVFGANSVFNRIILSPIIVGIYDRILEDAEEDILRMYKE